MTVGYGVVRAGPETCDDGNTSDGDGCSATCQRTVSTRFVVAPDGLTARDTTTGLAWPRGQSPTTMTYAAAVGYCSGLPLSSGGSRLPTGPELRGLVDATYGPAIDPVAFPGTPADLFWTSTPLSLHRHTAVRGLRVRRVVRCELGWEPVSGAVREVRAPVAICPG